MSVNAVVLLILIVSPISKLGKESAFYSSTTQRVGALALCQTLWGCLAAKQLNPSDE